MFHFARLSLKVKMTFKMQVFPIPLCHQIYQSNEGLLEGREQERTFPAGHLQREIWLPTVT